MNEEIECVEGEKAAKDFRRLAKRIISVPKAEIDRRAALKREEKKADKKKPA